MEWIENEFVWNCMKEQNMTKLSYLGTKFCYSSDFKYCLLVRKHRAWFIEQKGWRNSNDFPENKNEERWVLNFYNIDKGEISADWYKIFIPLYCGEIALKEDGDHYKIIHENGTIMGDFENHWSLKKDFLTGRAQTENEIQNKFELLNTMQ